MEIHMEVEENAIAPLIDTAISTSYTNPENLIAKHVPNINPIGMANFKSKSPRLKAKSKQNIPSSNSNQSLKAPVKKESRLNLNLSASIAANKSIAFQRWQLAVIKLKYQKDPWTEFHLENCPEEKVIRHRYNPIRKEWKLDACVVKMEPKQFANGAMRACFRLKKLSNFSHEKSWQAASNYVAKCYMDPEIPRERYFDDVRLQMDAKLWAEIYNRHHPPKKIDMAQVSILEFKDRPDSPLYHLEHFIEGDYVKYNSNAGFVEDAHLRNTPNAFSHFTFERSSHELMVVDIQGVDDLYTDPQIHTANGKDYGDGNLGTKGFALFFYSHVCNDICKSLGLTEFDLAPSECKSHDKILTNMQKYVHTTRKGHEEPVSQALSARSRYLFNRLNSTGENSNHLSEIEESEGYFSSSPSPLISPNVMMSTNYSVVTNASTINSNANSLTNNMNNSIINPFAQNFGSRSLSNQSGDTSLLDSAFENEEAYRYLNNKAFNRPRPSAVFLEKDAMLNADTEFHRKSSASSHLYESVLGKIHLDMCKYYEVGRFGSTSEHEEFDKEAAFFHLVQAANLGVTEALVNVAKIYLQLPHDILPEYKVDESDENFSTGFEYMLEAAEKGDKGSLYYVAKAYDTGAGLSKNESVDWCKAVEFYRKILGEEHGDDKGCDGAGFGHDITTECDAPYIILSRMAQIYMDGGHNIEQNFQEAADLFNEAAEKAMQFGKGRLANKFYMLAEEANSQT